MLYVQSTVMIRTNNLLFALFFVFFSCSNMQSPNIEEEGKPPFFIADEKPSIYCMVFGDSMPSLNVFPPPQRPLLNCVSEVLIDEPCFKRMLVEGGNDYYRLGIYSNGLENDTLVSFERSEFCCIRQVKILFLPYRSPYYIDDRSDMCLSYYVKKSPVSCDVFRFVDSLFLFMQNEKSSMEGGVCSDCRFYGIQCFYDGKYKEIWIEEYMLPLRLRKRVSSFLKR